MESDYSPGDEWSRTQVVVMATGNRSLKLMRLKLQVLSRYGDDPPKELEMILDLRNAKELLRTVQIQVDHLESLS